MTPMDSEIMQLLEDVKMGETSPSDAYLDLLDILSEYGFDIE